MSLVPVSALSDLPMLAGGHTDAEIQMALDWASDAVESYCERSFTQVVDDVVTVDPYFGSNTHRGSYGADNSYSYGGYPMFGAPSGLAGVGDYAGRAMLPNPPVTAISLVQGWLPDPSSVDDGSSAMSWQTMPSYNWTAYGLLYDTSNLLANSELPRPSWPTLPASLQVTYTHGFVLPGDTASTGPALPQGVVDAILKAAAYWLVNPVGYTNYKVGDVSYAFNAFNPRGNPAGALDETLLGRHRLVSLT